MSGVYGIPLGIVSDSYKATHYALYPDTDKMVAYVSFPRPANLQDMESFVRLTTMTTLIIALFGMGFVTLSKTTLQKDGP